MNKRRKPRKLTSIKAKITCSICSTVLFSLLHFEQHIQNNANCKLLHHFKCQTCQYVGHNELDCLNTWKPMNHLNTFMNKKKLPQAYCQSLLQLVLHKKKNIIILHHIHSSGIPLKAYWIMYN